MWSVAKVQLALVHMQTRTKKSKGFSGEVKEAKRHSQVLSVWSTHLLSDMDCGAPTGVDVETHTSTMLFTCDITVAVEPDGGPNPSMCSAMLSSP